MKESKTVSRNPNLLLCDYFDEVGQRVERLYLVGDTDEICAEEIRELIRSRKFEKVLDRMMAEANEPDSAISLDDAALALHALLHEVEEKRLPMIVACKIVSVGLNLRKAVSIVDIMPALEANFGGIAVSWARGLFCKLDLGPPRLH